MGLGPWAYAGNNLPNLGDPSQAKLPQSKEAEIGKKFMQLIRSSGKVIDDPIDNAYLEGIGDKLTKAADTQGYHFHFFWVNDGSINAFAGPGGYIGVNAGLIMATSNESELASVMAHEIAHVTQGHLARKIENAKKVRLASLAGMLAAVAIGTQSGEAAGGALAATMAGGQQSMLNFSRVNEREADRVGMETLFNSNFTPSAMPQFFSRLQEQERYYGSFPELLSSHPLTDDRVADAENRIAQYPKRHATSSQEYYLIRERLRVQTAKYPKEAVNYYKKSLQNHEYQNKLSMEYGYGLALIRNRQYTKANQVLEQIAKQQPEQLTLQLAYADSFAEMHQFTKANDILAKLHNDHPDNYAVSCQYAATLLKAKQAKRAVSILQRHQLKYPDDPTPYGLLSRALGQAGQQALAYQTRAQYYVENGSPRLAIDQLKIALQQPHLDPYNKARIQARLDELKTNLKNA